jgi:dihydrolipoamide dehydrogenase
MSNIIDVKVPDIGDFKDVPIIEVMVKPGDTVKREDSLLTLESEKATIDIPAPQAGTVKDVTVKAGDRVSEGTTIVRLEVAADDVMPGATPAATEVAAAAPAPARMAAALPLSGAEQRAEVVVLGGGPGGYTAAFRAADLGKQVVLVERYPNLGGVCLNVGCIPSKALLHVARVINEAAEVAACGVTFAKPQIAIEKLRVWKDSIVGKLTRGLAGLARQRNVEVIQGTGQFASANTLRVETTGGARMIAFEHCIIAAGSSVARIPGFPYDNPRLIDSTGALALPEVPKRLLVIGGGIIGLELATVFEALGSRITVVEMLDGLIPGADPDLVRVLQKRIEKRYERILLGTKVAKLEAVSGGLRATFEGRGAPASDIFDYVLLAAGRRPNGRGINAEAAGVLVDQRGFIPVDRQMRTNVPNIFGIGDIVGEPMLAHKATHEGKLAAEIIAGHKAAFEARAIPAVAYTDPEIAWMGLTETRAQAQGIEFTKAVFPWAASGRALATGREDGMTKLLFEKDSKRLLGAGIVGINAGELIAETVLALEMGADATDIGLTIHPHPTLSETVFFASEIAEGSITDLYLPKK